MNRPKLFAAFSIILIAAAASFAQETTQVGSRPGTASTETTFEDLKLKFSSGGSFQLETDIDDGGKYDVRRFNLGLGAQMELSRTLNLSLDFGYRFDEYDFSGSGPFLEQDAWDSVHTVGFSAKAHWRASDDWTIVGGPLLGFSRESEADWDNAFVGGGMVAAGYRVNDSLTIGGGLGAVSQIEDSARVFPVFIVDWRITEQWRLSNSAGGAGGYSGLELIFDTDLDWEFALGARYEFRRFRLDDGNPNPDGVGEEQRLPVWLRATWKPRPDLDVNIFGGLSFMHELELENEDGDTIADADGDRTAFFGASLSFRF